MQNKYINTSWLRFEQLVVSSTADDVQRNEMRKAFFAGASAVFVGILYGLDGEDEDPTEDNMELMNQLNDEVNEFAREMDADWMLKQSKGKA